jgi:exodeoxyribonuclease VII small subunit
MAKQQSFENSLAELEKIVRRLEDGDLSLDESLKLFEDGVRLSRECQERLAAAEKRIEVLTRDENGHASLEEVDFES